MKFFNQFRKYHLMDEAGGEGGAGGAGGGGAGSLLGGTGDGGNGTGDGGSGDSGGASGGKGNPPPAKAASAAGTADWRSSIPKELQEDASLKKFPDVSALAGAYVNAQKLIGADKIAVPNPKTATAEDWTNVWKKLGLPETADKYDVKFKDGVTIDQDFAKQFRENAHKAGVLPSQAQALADWFSDINAGSEKAAMAAQKAAFDKEVGELKTEWGNAFDAKIGRVNKMLKDAGAAEYFQKKGYGSDPTLFKYLDFMAEKLYKDAKIVTGGDNGGGGRTPQEIKAAIGRLQADVAYNSKDHPGHNAAVQEMKTLWEELKPPVDKK